MSTLPTPLRKLLEGTITEAREIAERGASKALRALAVHEADPYPHMNEAQRDLRRKLQAQARQLGDRESLTRPGMYETKHLAEKLAYDQWHRLLFARFLVENNLLISPEHGVSVSLEDCEELAPPLGLKDAWAVAARFAAKELPEIFRADDPAGEVALPVEDRNPLIQLVTALPVDVFTASDSLGWCYQYWQAKRKDEVNASGNKIGADELPAVTQLFTEDYMVDFLLDNTLGAWHAGKVFAANPELAERAGSEDELRNAVSLPACPWKYLRFLRSDDGKWTPAAGTFDGWPKAAKDLKCLDPCMGSGHFIVAMFERLVSLRIAEEQTDERTAAAAVIRDNLFGLEIDPRCAQIAAFNLALAAWRRVRAHFSLPLANLACSGIAPNAPEERWLEIAGDNGKLQNGMGRLFRLFKFAPILGSLVNPSVGESKLLDAGFHELSPLLGKALAQDSKDHDFREMKVTAHGVARAAELLSDKYSLVVTNVPYLGRGKQIEILKQHLEQHFAASKADLATAFVERCIEFCAEGSTTAIVTPQNWLFLTTYTELRQSLLKQQTWDVVARLGPNAFQDMNWWAATTALLIFSRCDRTSTHTIVGIDASADKQQIAKAAMLRGELPANLVRVSQSDQIKNPDARIVLSDREVVQRLFDAADCYQGSATGDDERAKRFWWELPTVQSPWKLAQTSSDVASLTGGLLHAILWGDNGDAINWPGKAIRGSNAWNRQGVGVANMHRLPTTIYHGQPYDQNLQVVIPKREEDLAAIWCYCSSQMFRDAIREIDQKLNVTTSTIVKVPFDLAYWQGVAAQAYPDGLPKPFSSDATQWLFEGRSEHSDQPLHVSVARLLGYRWPRQTGSSVANCPALGPDGLEPLADVDGIVCLSATKGEAPAAERLRALLAQALGNFDLQSLLAGAGPKGSKSETLEEWLRDEFFEQHCAIFHHRPFV